MPTTIADVTAAAPAGPRVVQMHLAAFMGLERADGTARLADITDLDLTDPIAKGIVSLRAGRFPSRAGEALLSPKLARAFGVTVGDTLSLSTPRWSEKIVGLGVRATNWSDGLLAVRGHELTSGQAVTFPNLTSIELVDLPGHPSDSELNAYPSAFLSRASVTTRTPERAVNWVPLGGIVALAILAIVLSCAF